MSSPEQIIVFARDHDRALDLRQESVVYALFSDPKPRPRPRLNTPRRGGFRVTQVIIDEVSTDPLGLTEEQRREGEVSQAMDNFLPWIKRNMEAFDALPEGTVIRCWMPGCPGHPVETLR